MKIKKQSRCVFFLIFAIFYIVSTITVNGAEKEIVKSKSSKDMAVISVETFTIGSGYIIEPTLVEINENETASETLCKLINKKGLTSYYSGSLNNNFYLAYIGDGDKTNNFSSYKNANIELGMPKEIKKLNINSNIPKNIIDKIKESRIYLDEDDYLNYKGYMGELIYTNGSGWLTCINNQFISGSLSDVYLNNGDVLRVQFSLAFGADIGGLKKVEGGSGSSNFYETVNKDELTILISEVNLQKHILKDKKVLNEYNKGNNTLFKLDASESEVTLAYNNLKNAIIESQKDKENNSQNNNTNTNTNKKNESIVLDRFNNKSGNSSINNNLEQKKNTNKSNEETYNLQLENNINTGENSNIQVLASVFMTFCVIIFICFFRTNKVKK